MKIDKDQLERDHLAQLKKCCAAWPDFANAIPERPQPPDFFWRTPDGGFGVELTRFHLKQSTGLRPSMAIRGYRDQVVEDAQMQHSDEARAYYYNSKFDRVYWLEANAPRAILLNQQ